MSRLVDETFDKAVEVLRGNAGPRGLRASAAYYNAIWARDAFISFLGANLLKDRRLLKCARDTILTFARNSSPVGQIPNFVDLQTGRPDYGYSGSTDSTCWYIIGLASLFDASEDRSLLGAPMKVAADAYRWLRCQDANNVWLIDSPPGADWMDAAVQRTGKTLYNNTLFLMATRSLRRLIGSSADPQIEAPLLPYGRLKGRFMDVFLPGKDSLRRLAEYWPRMSEAYGKRPPLDFDREYFLHYVSFSRIDTHFDTLSNLLCVLAGIADPRPAESVVSTITRRRLSRPYPTRVLDPPYLGEGAAYDEGWDQSLPVQHRSLAYAYHNGAAWPFVGGLHVAALYKLKMPTARSELDRLAKANGLLKAGEKTGFNEWIHGKTGRPLGQFGQSWSAGMFIAAVMASTGAGPLGFLGGLGK